MNCDLWHDLCAGSMTESCCWGPVLKEKCMHASTQESRVVFTKRCCTHTHTHTHTHVCVYVYVLLEFCRKNMRGSYENKPDEKQNIFEILNFHYENAMNRVLFNLQFSKVKNNCSNISRVFMML